VAGIGSWTLAQFSNAMSNGQGPEGPLYPAFPYQHYTLMSDQEIADLYAALEAVPPYSTPSRPHDVGFPFNVRFGVLAWQNLFFRPMRYGDDPMHSADWNRGRYLVLGPGHCVMCHSPRNLLGAIPQGKELMGNPAGGFGGKAPALTYDNLTRMQYDPASLEQVLKDGTTSGFDNVVGAMADVVRDETSQWTDADREAVATFLLGGH
jgi:mono/diheme cytochrome c family protein